MNLKNSIRLLSFSILLFTVLTSCRAYKVPVTNSQLSNISSASTALSDVVTSSDFTKKISSNPESSKTKSNNKSISIISDKNGGKIIMYDYNFQIKPLPGSKSKELLKNPDRGFRLETYFNPSNCSGYPASQRNINSCELLESQISDYTEESPQIAQSYIYLYDYSDKPLDKNALNNIENYLKFIKEKKIKIILVFAYEYEDNLRVGPTTDQVLEHISQLKPLIVKYRDIIHAWQAGFIGLWGEWHHSVNIPECDNVKVLKAILEARPSDLFVQVRMVDNKNLLAENDPQRAWVGYCDLYLTGFDMGWSTGFTPGCPQYTQETNEAPYILFDGEMPWGADTAIVKHVDGISLAQRLQKHHFTTMSLFHNYREAGPYNPFSMAKWKEQKITTKDLDNAGLRYNNSWFFDEKGEPLTRSMFAYIRDYLGYMIQADRATVQIKNDSISINSSFCNYGFAAPLGMNKFEFVVFNNDKKIIASKKICELVDLQPFKTINFSNSFNINTKNLTVGAGIGVRLVNSAGTSAKLSNDIDYINGINILGYFK